MKGHIRRQGDGSWELKFDLGRDPVTRKRQTRYHTFRGTKRAAQIELARLISEATTGNYIDPAKTTVAEFLDRWERDWAVVNVSAKTYERYRDLLAKHVRPHVGGVRIQKLRPVHLSELYAKLLREGHHKTGGLSPRTVGHVHRVLHRALGHAMRWGVVQQNVATAVDPPPVESEEVEILTAEQVRSVLQKLRGRSIYLLAAVGIATGMRRGEMLALRWKDVDLEGAKIRVEQSLEQTKQGLRFKPPKTKHGRRSISLPPSIVTDLRAHRKTQQELRLKLGLGKAPDDALVFANWDGSARSPNAVTKEWVRTTAALKLPRVSLHALRHTHASQLIASGLDVLTISRRLGHGSPTITLGVYGHLFANTDDRAAQVVEAAFAQARTE